VDISQQVKARSPKPIAEMRASSDLRATYKQGESPGKAEMFKRIKSKKFMRLSARTGVELFHWIGDGALKPKEGKCDMLDM
jgi:hypothetical protein